MARRTIYNGPPRSDLERFARLVKATSETIAAETDLSQATVWRVMAGGIPSYQTYRILLDWAQETAKAKRIPRAERLNWDPVAA